jgi:hypothetical protein
MVLPYSLGDSVGARSRRTISCSQRHGVTGAISLVRPINYGYNVRSPLCVRLHTGLLVHVRRENLGFIPLSATLDMRGQNLEGRVFDAECDIWWLGLVATYDFAQGYVQS